MKIKQSEVELLLKALVPDVELVGDESTDTVHIDHVITAINNSRKPIIESDIRDGIIKEMQGKFSGSLLRKIIRVTGLTEKELEEVKGDDEKLIAEVVRRMTDKKTAEFETKNEDVQKVIESLTNKFNEEKNLLSHQLKEATSKYERRDIEAFLQKKLEGLSIRKDTDKSVLAKFIADKVGAIGDLHFDEEKNEVNIFKKGTQTPMLNKAGNALFDWTEGISEIISPFGVIEKDTSGVNPQNAQENFGDKNGVATNNNNTKVFETGDSNLDSLNKFFAENIG